MKHIKFFFLVFIVAILMALLEVQTEGRFGWAGDLPTWKIEIYLPVVGMWGKAAKPLTGYHLYLWLFSFTLPHVAFLFTKWSIRKEIYLVSFYILFSTLEGILWFVVNPAFSLHTFNSRLSWYQEKWILGFPGEYWLRFTLGAFLYIISQKGKKLLLTNDK